MTREELNEHCERQVQQFERAEKIMPVTPNDWKRYEEHKLILELLEQEPENVLDKVRAEIEKLPNMNEVGVFSSIRMKRMVLQIIDKHKEERNRNDTDK